MGDLFVRREDEAPSSHVDCNVEEEEKKKKWKSTFIIC